MITLLINIFIKDKDNIESPAVRAKYGTLTGVVGILFNIILFATKGLVGLVSGSISIVADAFNNLSDAGSSIITMIGFRLAGQEADSDHPFGHGRSEYISGLVISLLILFVGFELVKTSIEKVIHPETVEFSPLLVGALVFSMVVKFYMFCYNGALDKKLNAPAMGATATDSINDVITTGVVLIAALVNHFANINVDGPCGILVGLVIMKGGFDVFKETSGLIMGHGADPEFKEKIYKIVEEYPEILGIHDLVVHDYGPGRRMISFHAEVPADGDILILHDTIDNLERHLQSELKAQAVVHMDPIVINDEKTNRLREMVAEVAKSLGEGVSIHDFRVVEGPTHTNLIFDLMLPFESSLSPKEARGEMIRKIKGKDEKFFLVITVDRPS